MQLTDGQVAEARALWARDLTLGAIAHTLSCSVYDLGPWLYMEDPRLRAALRVAEVKAIGRREAHASRALVVASRGSGMPVYAREACIYDPEALNGRATGLALHVASVHGYCARAPGGLWLALAPAYELAGALQDRALADQAAAC